MKYKVSYIRYLKMDEIENIMTEYFTLDSSLLLVNLVCYCA